MASHHPGIGRPVALCLPGAVAAHAAAVADMVDAVAAAIGALGREVRVLTRPEDVTRDVLAVVMLPNLLDGAWAAALPTDAVLYNFEQIGGPNDRNALFHEMARRHVLWDYSRRNLERLRPIAGHDRMVHVRAGYSPVLERIGTAEHADIDVLFYGAPTPRRRLVLARMAAAGLAVRGAFGVYGQSRDALMARAKLVVNIHQFDTAPLETVRIAHAMNNHCPVLTELGPDTAIDGEEDLLPGLRAASYEDLPQAALELVADTKARRALAARGYAAVRDRDMAAIVADALDRTAML